MTDEYIVYQDGKTLVAKCLNHLRLKFQNDPLFQDILTDKQSSLKDKTDRIISLTDNGDHLHSHVEKSVMILLEEYSQIANSGKQFLIDSETGLIVKELEQDDIFTPPDYIGEDGERKKSTPKLHPKISVHHTMNRVAEIKKDSHTRLLADPKWKHSVTHLHDPDVILHKVYVEMAAYGASTTTDMCTGKDSITFGSELIEAVDQSVNPSFHRVELHAQLIVAKLKKIIMPGMKYRIGNYRTHKVKKRIHYAVDVFFEDINRLT